MKDFLIATVQSLSLIILIVVGVVNNWHVLIIIAFLLEICFMRGKQ